MKAIEFGTMTLTNGTKFDTMEYNSPKSEHRTVSIYVGKSFVVEYNARNKEVYVISRYKKDSASETGRKLDGTYTWNLETKAIAKIVRRTEVYGYEAHLTANVLAVLEELKHYITGEAHTFITGNDTTEVPVIEEVATEIKLTAKETEIVLALRKDNFISENWFDATPTGWANCFTDTILECTTLTKKSMGGVLSSLVKKGIISIGDDGADSTIAVLRKDLVEEAVKASSPTVSTDLEDSLEYSLTAEQPEVGLTYIVDMKSSDISDFIVTNLGNCTTLAELRTAIPAINELLGDAVLQLNSKNKPDKVRELWLTVTVDGKEYTDKRNIADGHSIYTENYRFNNYSNWFSGGNYKKEQTPRDLLTITEKRANRKALKEIKDEMFTTYLRYGSEVCVYNTAIKEGYKRLQHERECEVALLVEEALEHLRSSKLGKYVSIYTPSVQHRHSTIRNANNKEVK